jgi:hypothetical protein
MGTEKKKKEVSAATVKVTNRARLMSKGKAVQKIYMTMQRQHKVTENTIYCYIIMVTKSILCHGRSQLWDPGHGS